MSDMKLFKGARRGAAGRDGVFTRLARRPLVGSPITATIAAV
jgi:hypothetical protein